MIITPKIFKELEFAYRKSFPQDFKTYLFEKYSEEPFPYEFTEQDFYENIRRDIRDFENGVLNIFK